MDCLRLWVECSFDFLELPSRILEPISTVAANFTTQT